MKKRVGKKVGTTVKSHPRIMPLAVVTILIIDLLVSFDAKNDDALKGFGHWFTR